MDRILQLANRANKTPLGFNVWVTVHHLSSNRTLDQSASYVAMLVMLERKHDITAKREILPCSLSFPHHLIDTATCTVCAAIYQSCLDICPSFSRAAFGTCSFNSFLDASNMASSCVFPPFSDPSLPIATNASGLKAAAPAAAPDHSIFLPGKRGVAKRVRMNEEPPVKGRVDVRLTMGVD